MPLQKDLAAILGAGTKANSEAFSGGQMMANTRLAQLLKEQAADRNIERIKQLQEEAPSGAGVKAGDMSITPDPLMAHAGQANSQIRKESQALGSKADKAFGPITGQLDALKTMHSLLNDPNSVDTQQLQTGLARLSEGQGQRLLDSVIQHSGANPTAFGSLQDKINYLGGGALSKLQPEQAKAIKQNLYKHQDVLADQYSTAKKQFSAQAPSLAPTLAASGSLQGLSDSFTAGPEEHLAQLKSIRDQDAKTSALNSAPTRPAEASGMVNKLRDLIMGGTSVAAPAQAPAAPQAAGGGFDPDAYLKKMGGR